MTKPLALLFHINLMPGSQLAGRLQDLGYRVQPLNEIASLEQIAQSDKPMVVVAEVSCQPEILSAIKALKAAPATGHIPVLAFSADHSKQVQTAVLEAGASLLASSSAVLDQLPQLLDQVLEL